MKARLVIGTGLAVAGVLLAFLCVLLGALNEKLWIVIVGVLLGIVMCDVGVYLHRYARRQIKKEAKSADLAEQITENMAKARALELETRAADCANFQKLNQKGDRNG